MINTPVISTNDSALHQAITERIHEVAAEVCTVELGNERVDVYGGKPGIALAYAWLGHYYPDTQYMEHAFGLLDELIDDMGSIEWSPDMGTQLAGAAFVLQHLQNKGIIDETDDLGLDDVDEFLLSCLPFYEERRNWDPLLGLVPIGNFFLERFKANGNARPLEQVVQTIDKLSSTFNNHTVWVTPGHRYQPIDCLNFGLAHGMPGLISFLSKVYAAGIGREMIFEKVNSCIHYLLGEQNPESINGQFPSYLFPEGGDEDTRMSRLGWCYGDLGMCFAAIHWGTASEQPALVERGVAIGLNTLHRNTPETAACTDAPLCHGSVSLVHQYNRLYLFTGKEEFKEAAHIWAEQTLTHFYAPEKGVGGYPFMTYDDEKKAAFPRSNPSLLEGAAGVALALASALHSEPPNWDALFLTDI